MLRERLPADPTGTPRVGGLWLLDKAPHLADKVRARTRVTLLGMRPRGKAAGVSTLRLPNLTAIPNYTSDTFTGFAPTNCWFEVDLVRYGPGSGNFLWYWRWVQSSAAGTYSANFSSDVDITPADNLYIYVYYHDPTTGNETYYERMIAPRDRLALAVGY